MAKSKSKGTAAGAAGAKAGPSQAPAKEATTGSSIDDIFAKPSTKSKSAQPAQPAKTSAVASSSKISSSDPGTGKRKSKEEQNGNEVVESGGSAALPNKKKKKKAKIAASFDPTKDGDDVDAEKAAETSAPARSRVVEVLDPSLIKPAPLPAPVNVPSAGIGMKKGKKRDKKDLEEDEAFRDSRGDGPRRKTEEGFLIYKEAELDIDPEAGGTPLCPFDCDCCF